MKTIIFSIAAMALSLLSFGKDQKEHHTPKTALEKAGSQTSFTTQPIVGSYLSIKNALVKSDTKAAAQAAEALTKALQEAPTGALPAAQQPVWAKITQEAQKQAKAIRANSGKLDHQRKAFGALSNSIYQLVSTWGTPQKLYQDFCPMYARGSSWLSETKDIKNPYYGAAMLTCGSVKETIAH